MFLVSTYAANGKMSIRYLSKSKKAKKGISPVIATVILVAVAVVIAAALAGFSSSLFGSYSQNSQVQIRSVTMDVDGAGTLDMVNKGGSSETVTTVQANVGGAQISYTLLAADNPTIEANGENNNVTFDLPGAAIFTAGQTATITVTVQSGQQYSLSTVVTQ